MYFLCTHSTITGTKNICFSGYCLDSLPEIFTSPLGSAHPVTVLEETDGGVFAGTPQQDRIFKKSRAQLKVAIYSNSGLLTVHGKCTNYEQEIWFLKKN